MSEIKSRNSFKGVLLPSRTAETGSFLPSWVNDWTIVGRLTENIVRAKFLDFGFYKYLCPFIRRLYLPCSFKSGTLNLTTHVSFNSVLDCIRLKGAPSAAAQWGVIRPKKHALKLLNHVLNQVITCFSFLFSCCFFQGRSRPLLLRIVTARANPHPRHVSSARAKQ